MKNTLQLTAAAVAFGLLTSASYGQNLLANGGFEADVAPAAPSGWTLNLSGAGGTTSTDYAKSGTNSLLIDNTGAGAWASPNVLQTLPASEGDIFNFQGYMLAPATIPDAAFGLLKIEFRNGAGAVIEPAAVSIGGSAAAPFFGAESTPFLNSASAVETWIFTETEGTAPANVATVSFVVLNVNPPASTVKMYFDDIVAVHVNGEQAWAGYPWMNEAGDVDTGTFLGDINVFLGDYVWSYVVNGWVYLPEENVTESGAWTYFYNIE